LNYKHLSYHTGFIGALNEGLRLFVMRAPGSWMLGTAPAKELGWLPALAIVHQTFIML
jgi:hypothetical protein